MTYENAISNVTNLYEFVSKFGTLEYTINDVEYKETADFNEVINQNDTNDYYIEVNKEIMNASKIKLVFNLRNTRYEYILRGDINE